MIHLLLTQASKPLTGTGPGCTASPQPKKGACAAVVRCRHLKSARPSPAQELCAALAPGVPPRKLTCPSATKSCEVLCIQGQESLWEDAETSPTCTLPAGQNSWDVWQMHRTISELGRRKLPSQQTPGIRGLVPRRCPLFPSCFTRWLTDQRDAQFEKHHSLNANPSWFKETNWPVCFGEHCHQLINSSYGHSDLFGHVAVPSSNTGQSSARYPCPDPIHGAH